jgi:acyl carrier protein
MPSSIARHCPSPGISGPNLAQEFIAPQTAVEKQLADLWCDLLQLDEIGIDDSFFDLGGNSLAAVRMVRQYHARFGHEIPAVKVFQHPHHRKARELLEPTAASPIFSVKPKMKRATENALRATGTKNAREAIAVVGLSGRFPGAANPDQLWRNLCNSVESISHFTPEELGPGIDETLRTDPNYIRARGLIEGADLFDAAFFGIGPA